MHAASGHTRVFTFGIGASVSHALVSSLARAGYGEAEFIASPAEVRNRLTAAAGPG